MRWLSILLLAAALGFGSAFLVACGDRNGLIPQSAADAMSSNLDQASSLVDAQQCRQAQASVVNAQATAAELPRTVDAQLRTTLADNLQTALDRVRTNCGKTTSTQTTPTTPTQTQSTATQTTTTQTQPTTTTTTPSPPPPTTTGHTTPPPSTSGSSGGTPAGGGSGGGSGGSTP